MSFCRLIEESHKALMSQGQSTEQDDMPLLASLFFTADFITVYHSHLLS